MDGSTGCNGHVEIFHSKQWGRVCNDSWDDQDASVVCRQLGFLNGSVQSATLGQGSGPIWLNDVNCTGSESLLTDCSFTGWGVNNCDHSQGASVACVSGILKISFR